MSGCRAVLLALLLALQGPLRAAGLDLEVALDPDSRRLDAVARLEAPAREFRFTLHESLAVETASADGKPLRAERLGAHGPLRAWRIALPAGARRLRLAYGGILPPLDRRLDHRGVLGGLAPMASASGSFLPAGSGWYPQPARPFSYAVALTLPAGQRGLVPGRLVFESIADGGYHARFAFEQPADGIDLMAGPYQVREKIVPRSGGTPLRLRTYFTAELDALPGLAEGYLEDAQRYLERYAAEIGAYPYGEFSVVASPLPTGFGMPTLAYLGAEVLRLPFIRATSLGHEVLHNWWGNGVFVDYAGGNWSEGLTTFMADYAYREDTSAEAAREMRLGWLRDAASLPPGSQAPLAAFRARNHGADAAVGYGKSAMLFLMLRDAIGAEAFRRGLRGFWQAQRFRAASWRDLQAAFEQAAGRPLAGFFSQWLERADMPQPRIVAARAASRDGKALLTLDFEQPGPAYALDVPVELVFAGGASEMRRIALDRPRQSVTLEASRPPEGVRLDPELRLWRRLDAAQLPPILRQWIIARAPRLALAGGDAALDEAAAAVARRLFENPPRAASLTALDQEDEPMLLIGADTDVAAALVQAGLPPLPAALQGHGDARAWTVLREKGSPLLVVSARDAAALAALARPLPHYGGQSWLAFENGRLLARGVWPAPRPLLPVVRQP
ncbi:MAG TPA: M1 family aminopeptidase [Candidatus Desulfobacillus sp.]|nr:M1 family aminopeptidase [Candidatus Desulfobacillus sp.]